MNAGFIESLQQLCGHAHVLTDEKETQPYVCDFLGGHRGRAKAVVFPKNAQEVQDIVRLCAQTKTPIVPQGGNTGYRAGSVPDESGTMLVLSTKKMCAQPHIDNGMMTAAAGCVLEDLQNAATTAGWFLPFTLGARGTCQIGGNMATNAGGLHFVKYGGARALCTGLQAVLPSGEKLNLRSGANKDNTGYDLRNLLIGSEGTLAIITEVSLRLRKPLKYRALAYAAVNCLQDAQTLFSYCREEGDVETFEIIPNILWRLLKKHYADMAQPFSQIPPLAVLVEIAADEPVEELLQIILSKAMADGMIEDAVFPSSQSQYQHFWKLRELTPEATKREGAWLKLDVCLPLHALHSFALSAESLLASEDKDGEHIVLFGHLGDGNLHLSIRPRGCAPSENPQLSAKLKKMLLDEVHIRQGSFSAEHGIGRTQLDLMAHYQDAGALSAMRAIKKSLDPHDIMNPGVLLPE